MVKSTKTPPRKPVKARGALPVPKSAPQRGPKRWYRRQGWQLVAIVLVIALVGAVWAGGGSWWKNRKENRTHSEAVAGFDRRYSVLKSPAVDVLSAMPQKTREFSSGTLPAPEFQAQTETWLRDLRKMDQGLRRRNIPSTLPELEEARAVLVQGYLVLIDAVKVYAVAAQVADPAVRDSAIKQGDNIYTHAGGIIATGERQLGRLKARYRLEEAETQGTPGDRTIQLPPEEAPTGQEGVPGQGATGMPGGATGMPPGVPGMPPGTGGAPAPVPAP